MKRNVSHLLIIQALHRVLSFDRREQLLDYEKKAVQFVREVWGRGRLAVPALPAEAAAPLIYAQTQPFMTSRRRSEEVNSGRDSSMRRNHGGSQPMVHDIAEGILKRTLLPQAQQLLEDAIAYGNERRAYGREPFLHPAIVNLDDDNDACHLAFFRDVSVGGVGLLHFREIPPQRISVQTRRFNDEVIEVQVDIAWCVPCGGGCYMSGGRYVNEWTSAA